MAPFFPSEWTSNVVLVKRGQNHSESHLRFYKFPPFYIIQTGEDWANNEESGYNSELHKFH